MSDQSEGVVELDIFSGRPNPSWRLTQPAQNELLRRLRVLRHEARPPQDPGLGYRGFALDLLVDGKLQRFRIGDGTVEADGRYFRDDNRNLEKDLMRTMPADLRAQFSGVLPDLEK